MRTCNDLGVCQDRTPPCRGPSCAPQHYFAPGVVHGGAPKRRAHARLRLAVRWALVCAGLMLATAVVAFVGGVAAGLVARYWL